MTGPIHQTDLRVLRVSGIVGLLAEAYPFRRCYDPQITWKAGFSTGLQSYQQRRIIYLMSTTVRLEAQ